SIGDSGRRVERVEVGQLTLHLRVKQRGHLPDLVLNRNRRRFVRGGRGGVRARQIRGRAIDVQRRERQRVDRDVAVESRQTICVRRSDAGAGAEVAQVRQPSLAAGYVVEEIDAVEDDGNRRATQVDRPAVWTHVVRTAGWAARHNAGIR